jgi:hypothetical protein
MKESTDILEKRTGREEEEEVRRISLTVAVCGGYGRRGRPEFRLAPPTVRPRDIRVRLVVALE